MRMFEAEELKKAIVNKGQHSHRYNLGDIWELNFKEICDVLNDMPTVEAIPIEWLEKCKDNYILCCTIIDDIIEEWREHEKQ